MSSPILYFFIKKQYFYITFFINYLTFVTIFVILKLTLQVPALHKASGFKTSTSVEGRRVCRLQYLYGVTKRGRNSPFYFRPNPFFIAC